MLSFRITSMIEEEQEEGEFQPASQPTSGQRLEEGGGARIETHWVSQDAYP